MRASLTPLPRAPGTTKPMTPGSPFAAGPISPETRQFADHGRHHSESLSTGAPVMLASAKTAMKGRYRRRRTRRPQLLRGWKTPRGLCVQSPCFGRDHVSATFCTSFDEANHRNTRRD